MSAALPVPTAIGRVIDLKYPSNRWAVLGSVGAVAAAKLSGHSWAASARVGLAGFTAWALARELDPDVPGTANVALALSALTTLTSADELGDLENLAALLPAAATLVGLRFTTGSTGDAPRWYDDLALVGAAAATGQTGNHAAATLPAVAALASTLTRDGQEPPLWVAPLAALAGLLPQVWPEQLDWPERGDRLSAGLNALALALSPVVGSREQVNSEMDNGSGPVSDDRLQHARLVSLLGVAMGLTAGQARAGVPLAAATSLVALRRLLIR